MLAKAYLDLKKKQEQEVNDFPIAWAFSEEQLEEALKKLGAERSEVCTVLGHGDVVKKTDAKKLIAMLTRHFDEIHELIKSDKDIAYETFLYEMNNHEYAINWEGDDDVLSCLGLNRDKLRKWDLVDIYNRAVRSHMKYAEELGII